MKKPTEEQVYLSMVPEEYRECVKSWLEYKKERKESYKKIGFQQMLKRLYRLSGNDPVKAQLILESAMSNNYAGFFELKEATYKPTNKSLTQFIMGV